jgi:phosphoribosylformimino-5-aminoimidazole carboxamide ribotide isomerase
MWIIPSIDLIGGECVRLYKGSYSQKTVYSTKPEETASGFEAAGAQWIHIVDLDAARGEGGNNRDVIRRIRKTVSGKVEVGGGIRSKRDVEELLEAGVDRLILGTVLVRNPDSVEEWVTSYGNRFAGDIAVFDGMVRVKGWEADGGTTDEALAMRIKAIGIGTIIYTNITQDGTLRGPDIEGTNRIAERSGLSVILSGGIGSNRDIERVWRSRHPGVEGIITGKAVLEGRVDLQKMINSFQRP